MIKKEMKQWLHDRGLTALQVAERAEVPIPRDVWRMFSVNIPVSLPVLNVLRGVYGMTEKETKEVLP